MISRTCTWLPHGLSSSIEQLARPATRSFSCTPVAAAASAKKQRPRFKDPYANKHAEARRAANIARQEVIRKERAEALGDPIRGITTPFVESFDSALPPQPERMTADLNLSADAVAERSNATSSSESSASMLFKTNYNPHKLTVPARPRPEAELLDHFLTPSELQSALATSHALTAPLPPSTPSSDDPSERARELSEHAQKHKIAAEALSRILSLGNASSNSRTAANTQRCIATFGRHETDTFLRPRPRSAAELNPNVHTADKTPRAGKDTGSSEVQIAILTAKIRVLADRYAGENRNDKVNKRNLRLLLHRRQKLLKYMEKKERGGERWRYMIETLGLTEATWHGQIEVR
ncbi:hypothetical protein MMC19_002821 [Ptychographa xylographoides]|nr:hypothetical protein [Ptychographa xylographoides]